MNRASTAKALLAILAFLYLLTFLPHAAADSHLTADEEVQVAAAQARGLIAIGAGLAVGLTGLGSGLGEGPIGAAAVGAVAENEALFGRGLVLTVIPETIVIFGLVVAILLLFL